MRSVTSSEVVAALCSSGSMLIHAIVLYSSTRNQPVDCTQNQSKSHACMAEQRVVRRPARTATYFEIHDYLKDNILEAAAAPVP